MSACVRWSEIKTTERPRLEQRRDGMFSKISTMVSVAVEHPLAEDLEC